MLVNDVIYVIPCYMTVAVTDYFYTGVLFMESIGLFWVTWADLLKCRVGCKKNKSQYIEEFPS